MSLPIHASGEIWENSPQLSNEDHLPNIYGYLQQETAYRVSQPEELTKIKQILQIGLDNRFSEGVNIKISGRFFYDAVFDLTDNFLEDVSRDQEKESVFRETYLNLSFGDAELTIGKQHIIWGEVPGLFFADIVTAKDYREFLLPGFEYIRIPPWAVSFQRFGENSTIQLVWIPVLEFDRLPKPGAEFAFRPPVPEGIPFLLKPEEIPSSSIENNGVGARWSTLIAGWNPAIFYFYTYDHLPAYFKSLEHGTVLVLTPRHLRIHQFGYTVSKDFDGFVLKSEGVLSQGKGFSTKEIASDGVLKKDFFEYVIGGEFTPFKQTRVNLQFFQRIILAHDPSIIDPEIDSGASIWINPKVIGASLNPELLFIYDFKNHDWMMRPKLTWTISDFWLLTFGSDLFEGNEDGLFGQFSKRDRVYMELRYNF